MPLTVTSKKSGKPYYLHIRVTPGYNGTERKLFYFSGNPEGAADAIPDGYTVIENVHTGLPFLKKTSSL